MLPDIHRATQKFYIFLIVYLTGCTPFILQRVSPLPAANSYLDLAAVVASLEASVVEASLEAAVVSVDVSVAVESALFKDTCAQSFWSTSLL